MEATLLGIPLWQFLAVACVSFAASIVGGLAGYGTGLLLPLALVPTVGPEPVVPIIGITALFTNGARVAAFWRHIDAGRAWRVFVVAAVHGRFRHLLHVAVRTWRQPAPRPDALAARAVAAPPGALALRARERRARARGGGLRHARRRHHRLRRGADLDPHGVGAAGLGGDRDRRRHLSIGIGVVKTLTFGVAGALGPPLLVFAGLIGLATFPGGFVARAIADRLSVRVHNAILDGA